LGVGGCSSSEPVWATDTVMLERDGEVVSGTQTWTLYNAKWERSLSDRHRVCTMTFDLAPVVRAADCEGCTSGFEVWPVRSGSDCVPLSNSTFTALRYLGVAPTDRGLEVWMDVGFGWERHSDPLADDWSADGVFVWPSTYAWTLGATQVSGSVPQTARGME
jgi:hypothetical protein